MDVWRARRYAVFRAQLICLQSSELQLGSLGPCAFLLFFFNFLSVFAPLKFFSCEGRVAAQGDDGWRHQAAHHRGRHQQLVSPRT